MKKALRVLVPIAALGVPLALPAAALADTGPGAGSAYTANLKPVPLNGQSQASGTLSLTLNGDQATVTEHVSGLAATFMNAPFPHVQHIHGSGLGTCPAASADTNGDGVISTVEGQPTYGMIQTTLSVSGDTSPAAATDVKIAPSGASFNYSRTITLSQGALTALKGGTAVIVVHGIDPATAPKAAGTTPSPLVPSLPLAATAPALCGPLTAMAGGMQTGGGSTSGVEDQGLFALAGGSVLAAGGALAYRRRAANRR